MDNQQFRYLKIFVMIINKMKAKQQLDSCHLVLKLNQVADNLSVKFIKHNVETETFTELMSEVYKIRDIDKIESVIDMFIDFQNILIVIKDRRIDTFENFKIIGQTLTIDFGNCSDVYSDKLLEANNQAILKGSAITEYAIDHESHVENLYPLNSSSFNKQNSNRQLIKNKIVEEVYPGVSKSKQNNYFKKDVSNFLYELSEILENPYLSTTSLNSSKNSTKKLS